MRRVCAWCQKDMGEVKPLGDTRTTHGICPECLDERYKEELNLSEMRYNQEEEEIPPESEAE